MPTVRRNQEFDITMGEGTKTVAGIKLHGYGVDKRDKRYHITQLSTGLTPALISYDTQKEALQIVRRLHKFAPDIEKLNSDDAKDFRRTHAEQWTYVYEDLGWFFAPPIFEDEKPKTAPKPKRKRSPNPWGRTKDTGHYTVENGSGWKWIVLKVYGDPSKPYARAFCKVSSPYTYGGFDMGDVYCNEVPGLIAAWNKVVAENEN